MERKVSKNNEKKTCTRGNCSKLKMFCRPKVFDILLNSDFEWGEGGGRPRE